MPKQSLASIAKSVRTAMKKHSPEILTGIGIAGMITTTVMAVKVTPKALILLEEKKDELDTDRLEPKDIIKTAWPCYIPAAVVGSISVFCLIAKKVNSTGDLYPEEMQELKEMVKELWRILRSSPLK